MNKADFKINVIERLETAILKEPTGELRNLLCDVNILLQDKDLPKKERELTPINVMDFFDKNKLPLYVIEGRKKYNEIINRKRS